MNIFLRPLCWVTRHNWLLHSEKPTSFYAINNLPATSDYNYQCQRCGKLSTVEINHIDNLHKAATKPKSELEKGKNG